jgi:hypothetical protein
MLFAMSTALLAACGGGGGDSPAPPAATLPYSLTLSPSPLTMTTPAGLSQALFVDAQIDRPIPERVNVAIIDRAGVLRPEISILPVSATAYRANLVSASTLTEGKRTGTFEIRICRDDPLTCASPIPGSPWQLPFEFTVTAPLSPPVTPPAPPPPPPAPPPPPPAGASFNPTSLSITGYQDELGAVTVAATLAGNIVQVFPRWVDSGGVFQPNPPVTNAPGTSTAQLQFSTNLAPRTYSGAVELRLCMDLPCTSEYQNSPALLPYTITVLPAANLSPLTPLAGASDWTTFQGNAGHTGYVPVTLDPTRFNRRWKWKVPASDPAIEGVVTPVVAADGRVHFVVSGYFKPSTAYALNEFDRTVAWRHDFGTIFAVHPPAVGGGKVFMASSGHSDTFMWSFDATSGMMLSKVPFGSQWERYYAPTIVDGSVYTNGGSYGGMLSFRVSDGTLNWFNGSLLQFDQWTPAVDATHAYAFIGGRFFALDRVSGATSYSIVDANWTFGGYQQMSTPILAGPGTVIGINSRPFFGPVRPVHLINFDTVNRSIRWSLAGTFVSEPAVAKGVIYVANGAQLEARSQADGSLLWSWTPNERNAEPFGNGSQPSNVIVTDNLLFVSTVSSTYAIDLARRNVVWTFPRGGHLALSRSGILYIAPRVGVPGVEPGTLTAINLN